MSFMSLEELGDQMVISLTPTLEIKIFAVMS